MHSGTHTLQGPALPVASRPVEEAIATVQDVPPPSAQRNSGRVGCRRDREDSVTSPMHMRRDATSRRCSGGRRGDRLRVESGRPEDLTRRETAAGNGVVR